MCLKQAPCCVVDDKTGWPTWSYRATRSCSSSRPTTAVSTPSTIQLECRTTLDSSRLSPASCRVVPQRFSTCIPHVFLLVTPQPCSYAGRLPRGRNQLPPLHHKDSSALLHAQDSQPVTNSGRVSPLCRRVSHVNADTVLQLSSFRSSPNCPKLVVAFHPSTHPPILLTRLNSARPHHPPDRRKPHSLILPCCRHLRPSPEAHPHLKPRAPAGCHKAELQHRRHKNLYALPR